MGLLLPRCKEIRIIYQTQQGQVLLKLWKKTVYGAHKKTQSSANKYFREIVSRKSNVDSKCILNKDHGWDIGVYGFRNLNN